MPEVLEVGLFGRKKSQDSCPVCGELFSDSREVGIHNISHAVPPDDGGGGYMWRCGCGESDGVWKDKGGAAAGLTQHMVQRHGIKYP
jgi:hypothetical protein